MEVIGLLVAASMLFNSGIPNYEVCDFEEGIGKD